MTPTRAAPSSWWVDWRRLSRGLFLGLEFAMVVAIFAAFAVALPRVFGSERSSTLVATA